jgi:hypothetical protein
MHYVPRLALLLSISVLGLGTAAFAEESAPPPPPAEPAAGEAAAPAEPGAAPVAGEAGAAPAAEETPAVAAAATSKMVEAGHFGVGARWRWVTVPGWFLGLFAQKNSPLSTFNCFAVEGFWRKRDKEDRNRTWEIVVSAGYQNMTPPDGIWLGKGKDINMDADLVQAKGFGLITFDASYVLRQYFSPYFGIHYGAGLGLGIVRGKILRTSATNDPATGKVEVVVPGVCGGPNPSCTEAQIAATEGIKDNGPIAPHRYQETSVPSAIPILNLLFGLDFPIPDAKGLEFRIEGGFYDAFFVGLTGGYVF